MSEIILREHLLRSFQTLQASFDAALKDASQLDDEFKRIYQKFIENISAHIQGAGQKLPEDNPLSVQIKGIYSAISDTDKEVREELDKLEKGLGFRKNFQDSLLVFVFGKVKSGKSSLGNYIAWGHTDPDAELKAKIPDAIQPEYFSAENTQVANGDACGEAKQRKEFRVGATEATSSIQGFGLPGLTWVDSPGLHSVNTVNGDLAKEYVKYADLILYTMRSDAPGRASDMEEIRQLKEKGKEILILVTGSDISEEDWDDDLDELITKLQMKSAQTRCEQRNFIAGELEGIDNTEIISISARYAQENATNLDAMRDSGMVEFFNVLHKISQQEGVRIKRNAPINNFCQFLTNFLALLEKYHQFIIDLESSVNQIKNSAPKTMAYKVREAQYNMTQYIDESFSHLMQHRHSHASMNTKLQEAKADWMNQLQEVIGHALESGLANISTDLNQATKKTWYQSSLDLPKFSIDKITESIPDGVIKSTRKSNKGKGGLTGAAIGGVLGFLAGGPLGAAIGATLGGTAGSAMASSTGEDAEVKMRDIEIAVGDNLEHIRMQASSICANAIEKVINQKSQEILEQTLVDAKQVISLLEAELTQVTLEINQLKKRAEAEGKIC